MIYLQPIRPEMDGWAVLLLEESKMSVTTTDLFEVVKMKTGCLNISDMRSGVWNSEAIRIMRRQELTSYPLSVLEDMADYLFGEKINFTDHSAAHDYFATHE